MPRINKEENKKYWDKYYKKHRLKIITKNKKYNLEHKEQLKKYKQEWKKCHPNYFREHHLLKQYGISLVEYNKMFIVQNGCCTICGRHQSNFKKRLVVDHCHKSNKIRCLLCNGCNMGGDICKIIKEYL